MTEILLSVLGAIVGVLVCAGLAIWSYFRYRLARQSYLQQKALTGAIEKLSSDLDSVKLLPRFTEGLMEVTKEQVTQLTELQETVKKIGALFGRGDGQDFSSYDADEAEREYEIQQMQKAGVTRQGAEARLKERDLWKGISFRG